MQSEFVRPFELLHSIKYRSEDDRAKAQAVTIQQWMNVCHQALPPAQRQDGFTHRPNAPTIDLFRGPEPTKVILMGVAAIPRREGERDQMAHDSHKLKRTWIINTKATYRDDCEAMRSQLADRGRHDYQQMVRWKAEKAFEMISRAKDLNFHQRDEIREIDGARYTLNALQCRNQQAAFPKMVKERQDQRDAQMQKEWDKDAKIKDEQEEEAKREKIREAHRQGDIACEMLNRKAFHFRGVDFTFVRKEAARVKKFREEINQEMYQEAIDAFQRKRALQADLDMRIRETEEEKAAEQARTDHLTDIRKNYLKFKITQIKNIDAHKQNKKREAVARRQVFADLAAAAHKKREEDLLIEAANQFHSDYAEAEERRLAGEKTKRAQVISDILADIISQQIKHEKMKADSKAEDRAIYNKWVEEDQIYNNKVRADQLKYRADQQNLQAFRELQMAETKRRKALVMQTNLDYANMKKDEQRKEKAQLTEYAKSVLAERRNVNQKAFAVEKSLMRSLAKFGV